MSKNCCLFEERLRLPTFKSHSISSVRVLVLAFSVRVRHCGAESLLILGRNNKGADHAPIASWRLGFQHVEPEIVTIAIRFATEITEVLHQHKRRIVFPRS